jgi:hypothetical protein
MNPTPPPLPPQQFQQPQPAPVLPYDSGTGVPCPRCGHRASKPVSFTWWGGLIGPKLLSHVQCLGCRYQFNGKTGRPNTTGIVIYTVVALAIVLFFVVLMNLR